MEIWLIAGDAVQRMDDARARNLAVSAEQMADFDARVQSKSGAGPRNYTVSGGVATIEVSGVLTKHPDFFAIFFGGGNTTYTDIIESATLAENDGNVAEVHVLYDSPGGNVDGLFEAIDALAAISKPIKTSVVGMMASAAYALGAQGDTIYATNRANVIGSVGVRATVRKTPDSLFIMTSTEAPKKGIDVSTEEGRNRLQKQLDDIHALYAQAIADGRGITVEEVNTSFGRGDIMLAAEAEKNGLIDGIVTASLPKKSKVTTEENTAMTLAELMAQHPALAAQIRSDARAEGYKEGEAAERSRVTAHLTYGRMGGDFTAAHTAIETGAAVDAAITATYVEAAVSAKLAKLRSDEDSELTGADGAQGVTTPPDQAQAKEQAETLQLAAAELGFALGNEGGAQ